MFKFKSQQFIFIVISMLVCGMVMSSSIAQAGWVPKKTVTLVCPWRAGGGTDVVSRAITAAINESKLSPVSWVVVNRTGGNGMVAMKYMKDRPGDNHTLMMGTSTSLTAPMVIDSDITLADLTPITNLIQDIQYLATHTKSGFKTAKELIDFAKKNPGKLRIATGGIGNEDHLTGLMLEQAAKIKVTYVSYSGGGEIKKNLLGGQIPAAWLNPGELIGMRVQDGGTVFPIAVAWPERRKAYPDVPTLKEIGYDVVFDSFFRGAFGTPGISEDVVAYYDELFSKAVKSPIWAEALKKKNLPAHLIRAKDFKPNIKRWEANLKELMPLVKATK